MRSSSCGEVSVVVVTVSVVVVVGDEFVSSRYAEALTFAALRCSSFSDRSSSDSELRVTRGMQRKWVRGGRLAFL